jgi:hypothetical protein
MENFSSAQAATRGNRKLPSQRPAARSDRIFFSSQFKRKGKSSRATETNLLRHVLSSYLLWPVPRPNIKKLRCSENRRDPF